MVHCDWRQAATACWYCVLTQTHVASVLRKGWEKTISLMGMSARNKNGTHKVHRVELVAHVRIQGDMLEVGLTAEEVSVDGRTVEERSVEEESVGF